MQMCPKYVEMEFKNWHPENPRLKSETWDTRSFAQKSLIGGSQRGMFGQSEPTICEVETMSNKLATRSGIIVGLLYFLGFFVALIRIKPLGVNQEITLSLKQVWVFACLSVFPPVWFFFESIVLYGRGHGSDSDYTHGQELASRLWVVCSVLAGLYWFHKV
jgi:hypothetical protein